MTDLSIRTASHSGIPVPGAEYWAYGCPRRIRDARLGQPERAIALTLFLGMGDDVDDRLFSCILPIEWRSGTSGVVHTVTALTAREPVRAGVTWVVGMYCFEAEMESVPDTAEQHRKESTP